MDPPGQLRTNATVFVASFQNEAKLNLGGFVMMWAGKLTDTEVSETSTLFVLAADEFHSTLHVVDVVEVLVGAHTSTERTLTLLQS